MTANPCAGPLTFPASTSAGNALSEANRAKTEADRAEAAASAGQATTTTLIAEKNASIEAALMGV